MDLFRNMIIYYLGVLLKPLLTEFLNSFVKSNEINGIIIIKLCYSKI